MATRGWFCKRPKDERYILLAGLNYAGKRTLIRKLTEGKTTCFGTAERTELKKGDFSVWDLDASGRSALRPLWHRQCETADIVIFVINTQIYDDVEVDEFESSLREVMRFAQDCLTKEGLQDCPLLVLANKQDIPGAMTSQRLQDLQAFSEHQDQKVEIIATSLVTGQGLPEVRDWIDRQQARRQLQKAVVQPLEKAVPPTLKSTFSRMSSALKQAFGLAKNKLPPVA